MVKRGRDSERKLANIYKYSLLQLLGKDPRTPALMSSLVIESIVGEPLRFKTSRYTSTSRFYEKGEPRFNITGKLRRRENPVVPKHPHRLDTKVQQRYHSSNDVVTQRRRCHFSCFRSTDTGMGHEIKARLYARQSCTYLPYMIWRANSSSIIIQFNTIPS